MHLCCRGHRYGVGGGCVKSWVGRSSAALIISIAPPKTHNAALYPAGTTPLTFKVTSATGEEGAFQQATATLPVNPACKVC